MPAPVKRKKLYFDVNFPADGATMAVFPCTQFRANYTGGDRYGALLSDLEPLTGGAPADVKRRYDVAAWFQPFGGQAFNTFAGTPKGDDPSPTLTARVIIDFVTATTNQGPPISTATGAVGLPYFTAGGATVPDKCGTSPIFTRHFGVRIRIFRTAPTVLQTFTTHGVVFVQRQHSIEI